MNRRYIPGRAPACLTTTTTDLKRQRHKYPRGQSLIREGYPYSGGNFFFLSTVKGGRFYFSSLPGLRFNGFGISRVGSGFDLFPLQKGEFISKIFKNDILF